MRRISENESIAIWLKKACGSPKTAREYKNRIKRFFEYAKIEPDKLVSAWEEIDNLWNERKFIRKWTRIIESYVYNNFENHAPTTRMQELTIIASFFKHNKIRVEPDREKHVFVKYHNRDLKREEIKRILEHADIRDRTFFLMMLESGLRPNTLVQLRYKHIKEDFQANRVPMKIDLPSELMKDRVEPRWTFIGQDALESLKEYLKPRMPLQNEDLIFAPERSDMKHPFLVPETFSNKFAKIALKLRITERREKGKPKTIRLYCLRKYFMNNIRCDTAFREFWMGHKTTQTHYVSRDIERHREEYARAYENLRIFRSQTPQTILKLREDIEASYQQKLEARDRRIRELEGAVKEIRELAIAQQESAKEQMNVIIKDVEKLTKKKHS